MTSVTIPDFKNPLSIKICALLLLQILTCQCHSSIVRSTPPSKILLLYPLAAGSESSVGQTLALELARKGHHITFVSSTKSIKQIDPDLNYTHVNVGTALKLSDFHRNFDPSKNNILEYRRHYKSPLITFYLSFDMDAIYHRCNEVYRDKEFKKVLKERGPFDLIFSSGNLHQCFQGLVHRLQAPWIVIHSIPFAGDEFQFKGLRMPPSFVPVSTLEYSDKMGLAERIVNSVTRWVFAMGYEMMVGRGAEKIYRKYLGQDIPDFGEIEKNVSMVFSNSHYAVSYPRPITPDLVEVGGMHCRKAEVLSKDLESFVSGGGEGFIFFSMGSMFTFSSFPKELKSIFLKVFSKLNQRILIKTDLEIGEVNMTVSPNIMMKNWLPQQDILGHRNIRLFISHGGIQSYMEAAYHGVPLIVLPIWGDQALVGGHVTKTGNGISLEILELTEETLERAILDVLNNPSYKQKAKRLQNLFRDQKETPLERAVYWTEFVLRHNGAKELRSAGRELNTIAYYGLDVIFLISIIPLITLTPCLVLAVKYLKHFNNCYNLGISSFSDLIRFNNNDGSSNNFFSIYRSSLFIYPIFVAILYSVM